MTSPVDMLIGMFSQLFDVFISFIGIVIVLPILCLIMDVIRANVK